MHEEAPILDAKRREKTGTRYSQRARAGGRLPAVVYGHKKDPVSVSIDQHEALKHLRKGERVFRIALDGGSPEYILLRDLQFDHLGTNPVHADFMRVDLNEKIKVRVPIHLIGEAKALSTAGAVMIHPYTDVEIECTLKTLPEFIEVDVSSMEVGDSITAGEVPLPDPAMRLITKADAIVAHIVIQAEEKLAEAAPTDAAAAGAASEPTVIAEKKKEERDAAKAEASKPDAKGAKK